MSPLNVTEGESERTLIAGQQERDDKKQAERDRESLHTLSQLSKNRIRMHKT